jgi:hypothetical protein
MQVVKGDWKFTVKAGHEFDGRSYVMYEEEMSEVSEKYIQRLVQYTQDVYETLEALWVSVVITFNGRILGDNGIERGSVANRIWIDYILTAHESQQENIAENVRQNLRILYGGRA